MEKSRVAAGHIKTLAIVSVYDPEGIVDGYLVYYLLSLKNVTDRMVVAVNGALTEESGKELGKVTDEVYIRQNTGFDFGAYKDVIENYLQPGEAAGYGQLVLCNDTCFGPFVPFEKIFSKMAGRGLEFWSINYTEDLLLPHFQSYFMVFREKAVGDAIEFLHNEVDAGETCMLQAHGYEHALSEIILMKGTRAGYYTADSGGDHGIEVFRAPDYAIKLLGLPVLKKKSLSEEFCRKENCYAALRLVAEESAYPMEYIFETGRRIYHEDFSKALNATALPNVYIFEQNCTSREDVIKFCRRHGKIYVYGNGYMSILFMARFKRYMEAFGGYVVSDEYYKERTCRGDRVYPLSCVGKDMPLIVALMRGSSLQVLERLRERTNVLFLSIDVAAEA